MGDARLQCTEEQLVDALTGRAQPMHREMLALQLERLQLIDTQIAQLNGGSRRPWSRISAVPGQDLESTTLGRTPRCYLVFLWLLSALTPIQS